MTNEINTPLTEQELVEKQYEREAAAKAKAVAEAPEKREKQAKVSGLSSTKAGHSLIEKAIEGVIESIENEIELRKTSKGGQTPNWVKALQNADVAEVANAALITCLDAVGYGHSWNATCQRVGRAVHMAEFTSVMNGNREGRRALKQLENKARKRCTKYADRVQYVLNMAHRRGFDYGKFTLEEYWNIGSWLINQCHLASGIVEVKLAAQEGSVHDINIITLTDEAQEHLEKENVRIDGMASLFSPMTAPPVDWPNAMSPYYDQRLSFQVPMVKKVWNKDHDKAIADAVDDGSMDGCIDALNLVQSVPYRINDYIAHAVRWSKAQPFEVQKQLAKFPIGSQVEEPKKPDNMDKLSKEEQYKIKAAIRDADIVNRQAAGNNRNLNNALEECEDLSGLDFYLPHHWDKRGRIYHVSPFGHHNCDAIRAMFLLANKSLVTEEVHPFLYLQLANTFGLIPHPTEEGKESKALDSRYKWVVANQERIYHAGNVDVEKADAENIAQGFADHFEFWSQADEPFQFLAACREFRNAVDAQNAGTEYYSGLPIAMDATQSGCQHFAAASLNKHDCELVNLCKSTPVDEPNDVYIKCLNKAQERFAKDRDLNYNHPISDTDSEEEREEKEKALKHKLSNDQLFALEEVGDGLTRKRIKRNVMTWAYSSRNVGLAQQLRNDWFKGYTEEIRRGERDEHPFGEDNGFLAANYIAGVNQNAIASVVQSAEQGMRFFQQCARILARENKHVKFKTPLGFEMQQFYRNRKLMVDKKTGEVIRDRNGKPKYDNKRIRTYLTDKTTVRGEPKKPMKNSKGSIQQYDDAVNVEESKNAVAPNIIHSMDATHLMMTVLECERQGVIDVMVVHDSFATNLGGVATLAKAIRTQFIALYQDYCLYTDFRDQCVKQLGKQENIHAMMAIEIPAKGDEDGELADLNDILESEYCFS